jgi:hypothetical protein
VVSGGRRPVEELKQGGELGGREPVSDLQRKPAAKVDPVVKGNGGRRQLDLQEGRTDWDCFDRLKARFFQQ